jgi:squalene-associated FAD-dependent desaturase
MPSPLSPRVLVVGGGLAGMASAVALESAGATVTLLEASRRLGGRAGSFQDPQTEQTLDNCQHVLLGCCTNLIDFYRRVGALARIRFERTIRFAGPDGRQFGLFGVPGLPAPLHLGPAFALFGLLTFRERLEVARAMTAILRADAPDIPFGQWLDEHGQTAETVRKLFDPIVISGLNEQTRLAGAGWAIQIFREALLSNSRGYILGLPNCPLGALYESLPIRDVRLGWRLSEVQIENRRVTAIKTQDGQTIACDALVLATNHHNVRQWIADDPRLGGLDQLQSVPILGAHLWFDRPILRHSHVALIDGPLQWLFRKDAEGKAVHGVISAARDWVNVPREQCLSQFREQVSRLVPGAKLERGAIVIEKRATFSPLPGVDHFRPPQGPVEGSIENLYLAGDYTRTGWPATMEGAVRSGYLAADAILGRDHGSFLVPDLPLQWPVRSIRHFSTGRTTSSAAR